MPAPYPVSGLSVLSLEKSTGVGCMEVMGLSVGLSTSSDLLHCSHTRPHSRACAENLQIKALVQQSEREE